MPHIQCCLTFYFSNCNATQKKKCCIAFSISVAKSLETFNRQCLKDLSFRLYWQFQWHKNLLLTQKLSTLSKLLAYLHLLLLLWFIKITMTYGKIAWKYCFLTSCFLSCFYLDSLLQRVPPSHIDRAPHQLPSSLQGTRYESERQ